MHSAAPHNMQQHDTYFVIAHFHYVMIGGSLFGLLAGIHYWFPKVVGRLMNEKLGVASFIFVFIGFNVTFFPHHFLGLMGMPRRIYTYDAELGWGPLNMLSTIGAFILAIGFLVFLINFVKSLRQGEPCGNDPWDARTLEWITPSPPPFYNFDILPTVHARDELWARKYHDVRDERAEEARANNTLPPIQLPTGSIFPLLLAVVLTVTSYGLLYNKTFMAVGLAATLLTIIGWAYEGVGQVIVEPKGVEQ